MKQIDGLRMSSCVFDTCLRPINTPNWGFWVSYSDTVKIPMHLLQKIAQISVFNHFDSVRYLNIDSRFLGCCFFIGKFAHYYF